MPSDHHDPCLKFCSERRQRFGASPGCSAGFSNWALCVFPFLAGSYESGDFMLHFAGKKGRVRLELVDYYYPRAKKVPCGRRFLRKYS